MSIIKSSKKIAKSKISNNYVTCENLQNLNITVKKGMDELLQLVKEGHKSKVLEKRIELLERLKVLEKYYGVDFKLPKLINENDENTFLLLQKSMNNELITRTYTQIPMRLTVVYNDYSSQLQFLRQDNQKLKLVFKNAKVEFFGQNIIFKEKIITYYNAILDNKEKTLNKYEISNENDVINIKFIPLNSITNKVDIHYNFK